MSASSRFRRLHLASVLCLLLMGLAGCSGTPVQPEADAREVDRWVMHGYLSDRRLPIEAHAMDLTLGDARLALDWTVPAQGEALPVLLYLPGLGESRRAGRHWRDAWASAGYAVLTIEPEEADRRIADAEAPPPKVPDDGRNSPAEIRARLHDHQDALHTLARERFQPDAAQARVRRLAAVVDALRAGTLGDAGLRQRLDLRSVALAGFDLGAYTAMLAAGERPRSDWPSTQLSLPISAVIALSPYADFSGTGFSQRYQDIRAPVLLVSGSSDEDRAGVVSSAYVRRAPFDHVSGHAGLLWLQGLGHETLAGSDHAARQPETAAGNGERPGAAPGGARDGPGGRGRDDPAGGMRGGSAREDMRFGPGAGIGHPSPRSATDVGIDTALISGTALAFLDAYVRKDPLAQRWLERDARAWVGERGEWKLR